MDFDPFDNLTEAVDSLEPVVRDALDDLTDDNLDAAPASDIDLQELAQAVFALLKQEARIERERRGRRY